MKKLGNLTVANLVYFASTTLLADPSSSSFVLQDPQKGIFENSSKVITGMFTAEWLVKGSAALFAITCFISAGNSARQGDYGRATGAVIGGIIAAIGAYLVSISQH